MNRKGQITIFIIVAIVLVALIAGFFLIKGKIFVRGMSAKLQPVETYYLDCIKGQADIGKNILGERAGWIYPAEFEPGDNYSPFSNQLDFQGQGVPYWYYIASGNVVKESVPTRQKMEDQLERYLEENLDCDFTNFENQGYDINVSKPKVTVKINDYTVDVSVSSVLNIGKDDERARQTSHSVELKTKLGKLHSEAVKIYNREKSEMFLELYSVDVLRLYAPVDGVELTCAPKTWIPQNVVSDLQDALEANIQAIRLNGNYYQNVDKYFIVDMKTDENVNFLYSKNWPKRIEIWPVDGNVMIAEPVGNQEGLGILGFCYVPYHFVYDLRFPVLVQVYDSQELFQFPVGVVIEKNKPRKALDGEAVGSQAVELCKYRNSDMTVNVYDLENNPVEANIAFKCFDTECDIGKTSIVNGYSTLVDSFPQCVNGFVIARAEGYAEKKEMASTNNPGSVDIVMSKLYPVNISLEVENRSGSYAVIYFKGERSATVVWPEQKQVLLSEGLYNVSVYLYANSSINFPATSERKCVEVAKPGILGIFGGKEENCFDINLPAQTLTNVLAGGGKTEDYFTIDRLKEGNMKIETEYLTTPSSLDQLQKNYELFETKKIYIDNG